MLGEITIEELEGALTISENGKAIALDTSHVLSKYAGSLNWECYIYDLLDSLRF